METAISLSALSFPIGIAPPAVTCHKIPPLYPLPCAHRHAQGYSVLLTWRHMDTCTHEYRHIIGLCHTHICVCAHNHAYTFPWTHFEFKGSLAFLNQRYVQTHIYRQGSTHTNTHAHTQNLEDTFLLNSGMLFVFRVTGFSSFKSKETHSLTALTSMYKGWSNFLKVSNSLQAGIFLLEK